MPLSIIYEEYSSYFKTDFKGLSLAKWLLPTVMWKLNPSRAHPWDRAITSKARESWHGTVHHQLIRKEDSSLDVASQWLSAGPTSYNQCTKEGNILFNDTLNTFYLWLYGVGHMVKDHSVREETRCHHMGYSFQLTAKVLLYAPSHIQDSTYHSLCYTSCGALAGTRNSSMGPPHEGSIQRPITPWANALTMELHLAPSQCRMQVTEAMAAETDIPGRADHTRIQSYKICYSYKIRFRVTKYVSELQNTLQSYKIRYRVTKYVTELQNTLLSYKTRYRITKYVSYKICSWVTK